MTTNTSSALSARAVELLEQMARADEQAAAARQRELPGRLVTALHKLYMDVLDKKAWNRKVRVLTEDGMSRLNENGGALRVEQGNANTVAAEAQTVLSLLREAQDINPNHSDMLSRVRLVAEKAGLDVNEL
jgi:hypothetical protein